jgi:hypothetical protein
MGNKIENQQNYITNPQFTGGQRVFGVTGSAWENGFGFLAGGLYVGEVGNLVVRTEDGSVLTFVSASGFIPGLITAVSGSTTAGSIIALK